MNLILFFPAETVSPLSREDPRATHLLKILRLKPGDRFDAGLVDGPRGKGRLLEIASDRLVLDFVWAEPPLLPCPLHLVLGLPRPQTARDILRDLTSLGVATLHFVATEKGEPSYAKSSLWTSTEWRQCLVNGAAQAFCTRLPVVTHGHTLADVLAKLPANAARIALDNYEASIAVQQLNVDGTKPIVLAIGAERGWSAPERLSLKAAGFALADLGSRVLRMETACIAATALIKAKAGWL